jgi:hypothetical protein
MARRVLISRPRSQRRRGWLDRLLDRLLARHDGKGEHKINDQLENFIAGAETPIPGQRESRMNKMRAIAFTVLIAILADAAQAAEKTCIGSSGPHYLRKFNQSLK